MPPKPIRVPQNVNGDFVLTGRAHRRHPSIVLVGPQPQLLAKLFRDFAGAIGQVINVVVGFAAEFLANDANIVDRRRIGVFSGRLDGAHSSYSISKSGVTICGGNNAGRRQIVAKCVRLFGFTMCCTFHVSR